MNNIINETLNFTIPEEMKEMTPEEIAELPFPSNEEHYIVSNKDKHTLIHIVYKKRHILLGRAASTYRCLKATEKKTIKQISAYKNTGYGRKTVDDKTMEYFSGQFTAQGVEMMITYCLYRSSGYMLSFECLYREEYRNFAEQKFEKFLSSVRFIKQ